MGFTLTRYLALSCLAASAVVYHAFATRQYFYRSTIYLSSSKIAVAAMGNLAFALALCAHQVVIKLFLGSLRDIEQEMIRERLSSAVMESLLALTIFREEFSTFFVAMFASLVFVKVMHWLVQDRVDYVEVTPTISLLGHARIVSFMALLLAADAAFLQYTIAGSIQSSGQSVQLLFAFEYVILASTIVRYGLKYGMSMADLAMDGSWTGKGTAVFYLELIADLLHLFVYSTFFAIVFMHYGLPLHLVRDLYSTFRNFRSRMHHFLRFRQVTARLDRFPDADAEDLRRCDGVCIICREEMAGAGSNKRLHCGHVFHLHCLRSWLERQQNCPTCRASVFRRPGAAPVAAVRQAAGAAPAAAEGEGAVPVRARADGGHGAADVADAIVRPVEPNAAAAAAAAVLRHRRAPAPGAAEADGGSPHATHAGSSSQQRPAGSAAAPAGGAAGGPAAGRPHAALLHGAALEALRAEEHRALLRLGMRLEQGEHRTGIAAGASGAPGALAAASQDPAATAARQDLAAIRARLSQLEGAADPGAALGLHGAAAWGRGGGGWVDDRYAQYYAQYPHYHPLQNPYPFANFYPAPHWLAQPRPAAAVAAAEGAPAGLGPYPAIPPGAATQPFMQPPALQATAPGAAGGSGTSGAAGGAPTATAAYPPVRLPQMLHTMSNPAPPPGAAGGAAAHFSYVSPGMPPFSAGPLPPPPPFIGLPVDTSAVAQQAGSARMLVPRVGGGVAVPLHHHQLAAAAAAAAATAAAMFGGMGFPGGGGFMHGHGFPYGWGGGYSYGSSGTAVSTQLADPAMSMSSSVPEMGAAHAAPAVGASPATSQPAAMQQGSMSAPASAASASDTNNQQSASSAAPSSTSGGTCNSATVASSSSASVAAAAADVLPPQLVVAALPVAPTEHLYAPAAGPAAAASASGGISAGSPVAAGGVSAAGGTDGEVAVTPVATPAVVFVEGRGEGAEDDGAEVRRLRLQRFGLQE